VRRQVPQLPPRTNGLRRDPALVALSRDHHGVLVQALGLRRAAQPQAGPGAVRGAIDAYLAFHAAEISGHMADEEGVLLPLAEHVDPGGAARIRAEHREIEALTARLRSAREGDPEVRADLRELGELLDDHVRFEERAFFARVQAVLGADGLAELGRALEEHRRRRGAGAACPLPPRRTI
jgi:hemerythrin-like domain-containing protein